MPTILALAKIDVTRAPQFAIITALKRCSTLSNLPCIQSLWLRNPPSRRVVAFAQAHRRPNGRTAGCRLVLLGQALAGPERILPHPADGVSVQSLFFSSFSAFRCVSTALIARLLSLAFRSLTKPVGCNLRVAGDPVATTAAVDPRPDFVVSQFHGDNIAVGEHVSSICAAALSPCFHRLPGASNDGPRIMDLGL